MSNYRELLVWQKAMQVAKETYMVVKKLPKTEIYVIGDQMRRAAVSIPSNSNIAEGYGRLSDKELFRFLMIARGSKAELETQLQLCIDIEFLSKEDTALLSSYLDELGKIMFSFMKTIQRKINTTEQ